MDRNRIKPLLARIGLPQAIGLYVDEREVTLSHVVATPWGPVEIARHGVPAASDAMGPLFEQLLEPILPKRKYRHVPVAIGLPAQRIYFATRPIQNVNANPSPHVLLREALRSTNVSVDEMVVDVIRAQPDKRAVASIAACDRKYLAEIVDSLAQCGVRPLRAEPAPCALLRTATDRHRAGRNAKVVLRISLSDREAVAVLVVGDLPVVWRSVTLGRGDEASAILSAGRSLLTVSKDCGIQSQLDSVMLHGRKDLGRLLDLDWLRRELDAPISWFDGPALEASEIAFGLALGGLKSTGRAFDLAGSIKSQATIWELIPWREAALQVALLVCMAMFLVDQGRTLKTNFAAIKAQNAKHTWMASMQDAQLEVEKRDLQEKAAAIRKFLDGRIRWTSYQRDLAASIPPEVFFTSFHGTCELPSNSKKRGRGDPKKSLILRGAVSIPQDGFVPQEIDRLLEMLREHPMLNRDFPVVELAELKQFQYAADDVPLASFTVVCSPKGKKK